MAGNEEYHILWAARDRRYCKCYSLFSTANAKIKADAFKCGNLKKDGPDQDMGIQK